MDLATAIETADQGRQWLLDHQQTDGSWCGLPEPRIDAYYKGSWALAASGEFAAAHRLLDHVKSTFIRSDGDLTGRKHPSFEVGCPLYPNAYVVVGSMVCGRYDVATPTTRFLLSRQDPGSGGFFDRRPDAGRNGTNTFSTGAAGLACLAAGKLVAARRAGDYLIAIVEDQPELDDRFYTARDGDGDLVVDLETDDDWWMGCIELDTPNQYWGAHMGLPLAFLIRLGEATDDDRYRELADWILAYQQRGIDAFDVPSAAKNAWAASMLYRLSGDEIYRELSFDIAARGMVARQNDDGSWTHSGVDTPTLADGTLRTADFDATAECTLWMTTIAANVASRDAT